MPYKSTSGIYQILNKTNHKRYVGSSVNLKRRLNEHLYALKLNKHPNKYLQNSWNKYGSNSFDFLVLEECSELDLVKREQFWINFIFPSYNHTLVLEDRWIYTPEAKSKISERAKERWASWSEETKSLIRAKIGKSKSVPILQFNKNGEFMKEFPSIKIAGEILGLTHSQLSNISAVCRGREGRKQANGFIWKYKNKITCQ